MCINKQEENVSFILFLLFSLPISNVINLTDARESDPLIKERKTNIPDTIL